MEKNENYDTPDTSEGAPMDAVPDDTSNAPTWRQLMEMVLSTVEVRRAIDRRRINVTVPLTTPLDRIVTTVTTDAPPVTTWVSDSTDLHSGDVWTDAVARRPGYPPDPIHEFREAVAKLAKQVAAEPDRLKVVQLADQIAGILASLNYLLRERLLPEQAESAGPPVRRVMTLEEPTDEPPGSPDNNTIARKQND